MTHSSIDSYYPELVEFKYVGKWLLSWVKLDNKDKHCAMFMNGVFMKIDVLDAFQSDDAERKMELWSTCLSRSKESQTSLKKKTSRGSNVQNNDPQLS
uniref:Uncharacterized protein n=1 Tax=Cucumis melo TaxID=3656 RepID=A0A9I9E2V0_CUCME